MLTQGGEKAAKRLIFMGLRLSAWDEWEHQWQHIFKSSGYY